MKKMLLILLLALLLLPLKAEVKAMWVCAWEWNTPEKIDALVYEAVNNNFNTLLVQVRYRADALYTPNRTIKTFPNPDPVSHYLADTPRFNGKVFDPLAYLLTKTRAYDIKIIAWATTFVATPQNPGKLAYNHMYKLHPEYVTARANGAAMQPREKEGAFFDPGNPEVCRYTTDVLLDIIANYEIDGIQLDYIRYPGQEFGYNSQSLENFKKQKLDFASFKEEALTSFIRNFSQKARELKPQIELSAAVLPNVSEAKTMYAQNWTQWLQEGYLDKAYVMAYTTRTSSLEENLRWLKRFDVNNRIVVGLRAWTDSEKYSASEIEAKISLVRDTGYGGFSLFSYANAVKNGYFAPLKKIMKANQIGEEQATLLTVSGTVKDEEQNPLPNVKVSILAYGLSTYSSSSGYYEINLPYYKPFCLQANYLQAEVITPLIDFDRQDTLFVYNITMKNPKKTLNYNIHANYKEHLIYYAGTKQTKLFRRKEEDAEFLLIKDFTGETSFKDRDVTPGVTYYYKLVAANGEFSPIIKCFSPIKEVPLEISGVTYNYHQKIKLSFKIKKTCYAAFRLLAPDGQTVLNQEKQMIRGIRSEYWDGSLNGKLAPKGIYKLEYRLNNKAETYGYYIFLEPQKE